MNPIRATESSMDTPHTMLGSIGGELKEHAPFTVAGTLAGVVVMVAIVYGGVSAAWKETLFEGAHAGHVFLSALATAGMYRLHSRGRLWATIAIGYVGSIGVATLSDCLIPYLGESLLGLHPDLHLEFIETWWLVNPLAAAGIAVAFFWSGTKVPHAGHVLLSIFASLLHVAMALGAGIDLVTWMVVAVFLFLAVWIPCCTSDIVFPLLFSGKKEE